LARAALKVYVNASAGQSEPGVVGRFYEGRLDEVALYNGALSNAQIQSHYKKSFS